MNKIKNFLYVYTGLRSLTNAIKHWLGMTMLEAKFNQLHDEYADTIDEKVDEIVEDKGRDIQNDLEYEIEAQVNDGIEEKYSDSISDAVVSYADDILPSMINKSIDETLQDKVKSLDTSLVSALDEDMGVMKSKVSHIKTKVEALEKFIEVLVDKQSWFLDEVENSSDNVRRIASVTNSDISQELIKLKEEA